MLDRRRFLASLFAAGIPLPQRARAAESRAPRNLKITDVQVLVTNPAKSALGNYVVVKIATNQSSIPIAMGEVFVGQWEGLNLITDHLIDYVRHDLAHVGGVTTGKKVATVCEPYGILTAWHGPGNISPISHMANAHVSLSVSNFGIQEYAANWGEAAREVFSAMPAFADGYITIDKSGLGIEVNEAAAKKYPYLRRLRPTIRRADGTAWPY